MHAIPTTLSNKGMILFTFSGYACAINEYAAVFIMPDAELARMNLSRYLQLQNQSSLNYLERV